MSAKHTPGPWGIGEQTVTVRSLNFLSHAHYETAEGRANTQLIKAAPDLLEALMGYMSAVETMNAAMQDGLNVHGAVAGLIGWEDMAKLAIAKATGSVLDAGNAA